MTTSQRHAPQIAQMLAAVAGADWNVKWAQVNRAAGTVCGICISTVDAECVAAHRLALPDVVPGLAQDLVAAVSEELRNRVGAEERVTLVEGLAKRVAQGLVGFYEGTATGEDA